jgi:hypothetical protein
MADEPENTEDHIEVTLETVEKIESDEPKVEIEEEQPEVSAKPEETAEIPPEKGIQELKRRLEEEKQARIQAEKQAREAHERALKANTDKSESQYQLVVNAIETVKERAKALETAYAEALSVGDTTKAAEIVSAMSSNNGQLERLKDGKKAMKRQMQEAEEQAKQPLQQVQPRGSIVDQLIDNVSQTSRASAEWLDANRAYIRDERDVRKMFRAHEDAIDDGIRADTPEYFEFIESRLGVRRKVDDVPEKEVAENPMSSASAPAQKRSTQPPPAPVTRGTPRPNTMRLSKDEAETARALGYTPEEYAKNKALLMKEGRYGH